MPNYIQKDWFKLSKDFSIVCITTNGMIKNNGDAVLGAGIAKQAVNRWGNLPSALGKKLKENGNIVQPIFKNNNRMFCNFPVKHNWYEQADLELIDKSCQQVVELLNESGLDNCLINYPGVGNGKLSKEEVKPILDKWLDDRFTICYL